MALSSLENIPSEIREGFLRAMHEFCREILEDPNDAGQRRDYFYCAAPSGIEVVEQDDGKFILNIEHSDGPFVFRPTKGTKYGLFEPTTCDGGCSGDYQCDKLHAEVDVEPTPNLFHRGSLAFDALQFVSPEANCNVINDCFQVHESPNNIPVVGATMTYSCQDEDSQNSITSKTDKNGQVDFQRHPHYEKYRG